MRRKYTESSKHIFRTVQSYIKDTFEAPSILCVFIFMFPFILGLMSRNEGRAIKYLAGDVYYYLVVARQFLETGMISYDGEYPTNGFHPLWQMCIIMLTAFSDFVGMSKYGLCTLVLITSIVIILCALLLLSVSIRKAIGFVPWTFCLLPLGVCGLLSFLGKPWVYLSLWSYADGMETSLVLFAYCCFLYFGNSDDFLESGRNAVGVGCSITFLSLARLDHALIILPLAAIVVGRFVFNPSKSTFIYLVALVIPAISLITYMGINLLYAGTPIPLSGAYKSSFPHVFTNNFYDIHSMLVNPFSHDYNYLTFRFIQLFVPAVTAIVALIILLASKTYRRKRYTKVLVITAAGVLMLFIYNILYVGLSDHGHWYFPVSVLFVSLFPLLTCSTHRKNEENPFNCRTKIKVLCLLAVISAGIYHAGVGNMTEYFVQALAAGESVKEHYAGQNVKFIAYDDGMFAFASERNVLCGSRLVLDKEAYDLIVHKKKPFLSVALERGYNRVVLKDGCIGRNLETEFGDKAVGDMFDEKTLSSFGVFGNDYGFYVLESPLSGFIEILDPDNKVIVLRLEPLQDGVIK